MKPISLLSESFVHALGWTLVHSLWQGTVLVVVTALAFWLFRQTAPVRYRLGILVLLVQLLVSAVTFFWYYSSAASATHGTTLATHAGMGPVATVTSAPSAGDWLNGLNQWLTNHLTGIAGGWLLGAGLLLIRLLGGWLLVQRLTRQGITPAPEAWQAYTQDLAQKLGALPVVQLMESVHISVPMTIGWLKPVVLLPIGLLAGLSPRQVEAVLAHELAHIRRFDYLVNLIQSVVEVLFFYHPAIWWLSARIRDDREHCCDDIAIQFCGERTSLAKALVYMEERRQAKDPDATLSAPSLAMAFGARRTTLLHRVKRVLGVSEERSTLSTNGLAVVGCLIVLGGLLAGQQVQSRPRNLQSSVRSAPYLTKRVGPINAVIHEPPQKARNEKSLTKRPNDPSAADTLDPKRVEQLEQQIQRNEAQMDELNQRMEAMNKPMESLNAQMEQYNQAMEKARQKLEKMTQAQEPYMKELMDQQQRIRQLNQPLRKMDKKAFERAQAKLAEVQRKIDGLNGQEMQRINEDMQKLQEQWGEKMQIISDSIQTLLPQNFELAQESYQHALELQHLHQEWLELNGAVVPPIPPLPPVAPLLRSPKAPKAPRVPHKPAKPKAPIRRWVEK